MKRKISITLSESVLLDIDSIVDNVYIRNRSQAIEHLVSSAAGENKTAVILCGGGDLCIGKGVFRPTAKIGKSTVIEMALRKLRQNNFKQISIVAMHDVLTAIFSLLKDGTDFGVQLHYIEEKEGKGTAHTLSYMKGKITSNFLVVYGDILFDPINLEELWKQHLRENAVATLLLTPSDTPSTKGAVTIEGNKVLTFSQKEKDAQEFLVFSAIFVSGPEIFDYSGVSLENNVFTALAHKGLLHGYVSSKKEVHIHSAEDAKKYKDA